MKTLLLGLTLGCAVWALADDRAAPEGMVCRGTIVVEYHSGPNWEKFGEHVRGHLDYLRTQMKAGRILYGGPFEDANGGLSVYALTDPHEVDALVHTDPLVANKVVTYSMRHWRMCSLDNKQ